MSWPPATGARRAASPLLLLTRRRQSRCSVAADPSASPPTAATSLLLALPFELLIRIISLLDSAVDVAWTAAVSRLFRDSLADEGMRLREQEGGYEVPNAPEGECPKKWRLFVALMHDANRHQRIAAGSAHSIFVDEHARLSSCGKAAYLPALLGHGEGVRQLMTPTRLASSLDGERVVGVSAGPRCSYALTARGGLWSWGRGACSGHGDEAHQPQPREIDAFAGLRVRAVSAGGSHGVAITDGGGVWSWGVGTDGRLGHGDYQNQRLPQRIAALDSQRVVAVSAGGAHCLALTSDGAVFSWGYGAQGQLGLGDYENHARPERVEALRGMRVVAVSAGGMHSLAITADGAVWSWGHAAQVGHGCPQCGWAVGGGCGQLHQLLPKRVEALAGRRVVAVSVGWKHNLAITADGDVWSWGDGKTSQLGHGTEENQGRPKRVEALSGWRVVAVAAGNSHSLAATAEGAVFSWGYGRGLCLGHGEDESNQSLPKKIEVWAAEVAEARAGAVCPYPV